MIIPLVLELRQRGVPVGMQEIIALAAALKADLSMFEGTGGTQIKGLITYSGIVSHTASTVGTNGNTFQPGF